MPSFKEIFDSVKNRNDEEFKLNEAYEVGEAAKALYETQKMTKAFYEWLSTDFAKQFKNVHMTPNDWEVKGSDMQMELQQKFEQLEQQIRSLDNYLYDTKSETNPQEHPWRKWDAN